MAEVSSKVEEVEADVMGGMAATGVEEEMVEEEVVCAEVETRETLTAVEDQPPLILRLESRNSVMNVIAFDIW